MAALFKQKITLCLISLTLVFALLGFSLLDRSAAWFSENDDVDARNMSVTPMPVDDTSVAYKAYMFDLKKMVGVDSKSGENDEPQELSLSNLDMNQYDTIFSVQNQYTPAFAQIKIKRSAPATETESGTFFITVYRNSEMGALESNGKLSEYISSVLRFTALIDSTGEDRTITDANELYRHINTEERFEKIKNYKGERDDSKTFVSVHGEGETHSHDKVDSITVGVSYTGKDWYLDEDGCQTLNIYLYMSYDVQLIECFLKEHASDNLSLNDTSYNFKNDLEEVDLSYVKLSD